ncbi:hypothetical protein HWV62_13132 [Athelia sp. TMB]|nr:hypothetical protein HWV62_13132 [Athelia sp. TMB]
MFQTSILRAGIDPKSIQPIDKFLGLASDQRDFTPSATYKSATEHPAIVQTPVESISQKFVVDTGKPSLGPIASTSLSSFSSSSSSSDSEGTFVSSVSTTSSEGVAEITETAIAVAPILADAPIPTRLAHNGTTYTLHGVIGRGAFGKVVFALTDRGAQVAIKICSKRVRGGASTSGHRWLVMNERDALVRIAADPHRSAFVTAPLACFQDAENIYFVLRMYHHILLDDIYSRALSLRQTKIFAAELLLALEALHCMGIVHRDLKPENILVTPNGHLAIADFGLARLLDPSTLLTARMHERCGTMGYLAPEVISDQIAARGYTSSVDVWGFGMLVYEMLISHRTIDTASDEEDAVLNRAQRATIHMDIDMHVVVGNLDALAADLLHQLLAIEEAARPAWAAIREHAWFADVDWALVEGRRTETPLQPEGGNI